MSVFLLLLCCMECSGFLLLSLFSVFVPMPQGLVPAPATNCFCLQVTCCMLPRNSLPFRKSSNSLFSSDTKAVVPAASHFSYSNRLGCVRGTILHATALEGSLWWLLIWESTTWTWQKRQGLELFSEAVRPTVLDQ